MYDSKIRRAAMRGDRPTINDYALMDPDISHLHGDRVDRQAMRAYRLGRVREELAKRDLAGTVLFDPVNVRYATGTRNMAVWHLHNPARYAFVATDGPVIVFEYEYGDPERQPEPIETVDEVRPAMSWYYFGSGEHTPQRARLWAREIAELVDEHGGGSRRIAIDNLNPEGAAALAALGVETMDGYEVLEQARAIKSAEEIAAMRIAIDASQKGMDEMRRALVPGVTENELWAELHRANIAHGGEWIETRLLSSGPRTNPWFQECSDRPVRDGELLAFDTDLIGVFGYCVDISRTWVVGDRPTDEQRRLYSHAVAQIAHNTELLRPGATFREIADKAWRIPDEFLPLRYSGMMHGVGMCDEWPGIAHRVDFEDSGYDGVIEANMTICVESYIGAVGGAEGIKLEQQVLVTEDGPEVMSTYPLEEDWL